MATKKNLTGLISKSSGLPDRTATCIASTARTDSVRDIVEGSGMTSRSGSVVMLYSHDPLQPIGRAAWRYDNAANCIRATLTFAPAGVSATADMVWSMVKAGVLTDVSVGFDSTAREPIPGGGWRYTKSTLYEISVCAVGANPDAVITGKQRGASAPRTKAERMAAVARMEASAPASARPSAPRTKAARQAVAAALAAGAPAPRACEHNAHVQAAMDYQAGVQRAADAKTTSPASRRAYARTIGGGIRHA